MEEKKLTKEEKTSQKKLKAALEKQRIRIHNDMVAYQKKFSKERKTAPKGVFISLQHVNKIYDNHVQAVYDFNLDVKQHEFICLVGPSGCGKSTTLRMIAGLENITAGNLFIDEIYANDLEPKNRDIAMVFQSYALYPHMSVRDNMAFSLKIRKVPTLMKDKDGKPLLGINKGLIKDYKEEKANYESFREDLIKDGNKAKIKQLDEDIKEIQEKINYLEKTPVHVYKNKHLPKEEIESRVNEAANILQITDYLNRKPKALSGGQCQRVALGRAIVRNAKVFLMDEPLSNLDAKLRVQMRSEIINLHNKLDATTIYVTHDQTEAMTMATRIVVMNKGYIQQIGTPREIYNNPANVFVATFIGSPSMNLYETKFNGKVLSFANNDKINLKAEDSKKILNFYKTELAKYKTKEQEILSSFVERNEALEKLKLCKGKKAEEQNLKEEIKALEESNEQLVAARKAINEYGKFMKNKTYDVIFGIRPEDIHIASDQIKSKYVKKLDAKIQVAELLGHEYFIHTPYNSKDLVSKIRSQFILSSGDKIKLVFDLNKVHIFDRVTQNLIY